MTEVKVAPPARPLFYVGVDGTEIIDTLAWGALWRKRFGWSNLLLELAADPADSKRRLDAGHPILPMISSTGRHLGVAYTDTCMTPEGLNGGGVDPKWPSKTPTGNVAQMNAQLTFTQGFVLNPRVDSKTKALSDTGDLVADVVFISSHGATNGDMFGIRGYTQVGVDYMFSLSQATVLNRRFKGPKWLLLSNCNTLFDATHNDWLDLIADPATPLRGIAGFRDACPLADGSVDLYAALIEQMARGKTIVAAWQKALTDHNLEKNWIVLCHDAAGGDTIQDWNAGKLAPITPLAPPSVKQFTSDTPTGRAVTHTIDPFSVFWSKGGTRVDASNRTQAAFKIATGDKVTITVGPPGGAASFTAGTKVGLVLIYIRPTYQQIVDVTKMFAVDQAASTGIAPPVTVTPLNRFRFKADAPDSWVFTINGTPPTVVLALTCGNLDLSNLGHHNAPLYLLGVLKIPGVAALIQFQFIRNGSIIAA